VITVNILYRVSLPKPLPSHRLILGSILAAVVFLVATFGLRVYLTWITSTGYTYGALATPIAFLLFAFFLGFAIMLGAELNAAIQEEWPAPATHALRLRWWLERRRSHSTAAAPPMSLSGEEQIAATRRRQRRPKPTTLLLELLVYPLAIRADRRSRLGGLSHRKHLAAERDDVGTHDGALGDLVLLHVMEDLRVSLSVPSSTRSSVSVRSIVWVRM